MPPCVEPSAKPGAGGLSSSRLPTEPLVSFINPDAADFMAPDSMPRAIGDFCAKTEQPVPPNEGAVLRCALDSLAMMFRHVLGMCEELAGGRIETIHIVGGGTQNRLLCQAAADASGRRVSCLVRSKLLRSVIS